MNLVVKLMDLLWMGEYIDVFNITVVQSRAQLLDVYQRHTAFECVECSQLGCLLAV